MENLSLLSEHKLSLIIMFFNSLILTCKYYFQNYSEEEEEEDVWVGKVEDLAAQVRKTNKMWKNKLSGSEFTVTKDTKK